LNFPKRRGKTHPVITDQIKSRERVRELGEVLTRPQEVNAMLDLLPKESWATAKQRTFLEPACGTGNFLEEILSRKLTALGKKWAKELPGWKTTRKAQAEFEALQAIASIYGVDICPHNVSSSRLRLENFVRSWANYTFTTDKQRKTKNKVSAPLSRAFEGMLDKILRANIVEADFLAPGGAAIAGWSYPKEGCFLLEWHLIANLGQELLGKEIPPVKREPVMDFYAARRLEK
jgi:hypothetical protein